MSSDGRLDRAEAGEVVGERAAVLVVGYDVRLLNGHHFAEGGRFVARKSCFP